MENNNNQNLKENQDYFETNDFCPIKKINKKNKNKNKNKKVKYPINIHNYYKIFELSNSSKTIEGITPTDVAFTRNLSQLEILNRCKIMPYVSNKSIYNPIKKKLKVFLLDGDAIGKDNLISTILLVKLLNLLSTDTFYIIRNISNISLVSNIFSEMNRDIFLQTLVPMGTPNKADNIIAVELGAMMYEFTCSGQKAEILVVSDDKAVLELYEAPNILNRSADNIFVNSINKTDFINLTKIGIIPAPFYVVVKVCDLDLLQLSLSKINPTAHILIFLQVFHNYIHEIKKIFLAIDDILNTSTENLNSILNQVNSQIAKFDLGSDMSPRGTCNNNYKYPLDLSIILENNIADNNKLEKLNIDNNTDNLQALNINTINKIYISKSNLKNDKQSLDKQDLKEEDKIKENIITNNTITNNTSKDIINKNIILEERISTTAIKDREKIKTLFSEICLNCFLEIRKTLFLSIGNELQIKSFVNDIEKYYIKYKNSKVLNKGRLNSLSSAVIKRVDSYNNIINK